MSQSSFLTACQIVGLLILLPDYFIKKERLKAFEDTIRNNIVEILKTKGMIDWKNTLLHGLAMIFLFWLICVSADGFGWMASKSPPPLSYLFGLFYLGALLCIFPFFMGLIGVPIFFYLRFIASCPKGVLPAIGFPAFVISTIMKMQR